MPRFILHHIHMNSQRRFDRLGHIHIKTSHVLCPQYYLSMLGSEVCQWLSYDNCNVIVFRCPFIEPLGSLFISSLGTYFKQVCVGQALRYPCFPTDIQLIARSAMRRDSRGLTNATDTEYTILLPTFLYSCYYWMLIPEYETQWLLSGTYSDLSEATATSEQLRYAAHS